VLIYENFTKNVFKFPNKKALIFKNTSLTYKELYDRIESYNINLKPFSHIGVYLENSIEFVELMLLASKYNLTLIPFSNKNIDYNKFDIEYIYNDKFQQINPFKPKQSGYIIVSTSGSTSEPKPIVLTQEIKLRRINIAKETYNISNEDIILVSTPLYHSLAQRGVLISLVLGATCVLMKEFKANIFLELIEKEKVTFTFAVSNQIEIIKEKLQKYDISSLKSLVSTSYALKSQTKKEILKYTNVYECYGTSEIGCITQLSPNDINKHPSSVGCALRGIKIRIKNGEILVKSPWRFKEYYKMPDTTKESFDGDFFKTGDLGEIVDGYLYYKGRKKDLIKTGGISVYPMDIEKVLKEVNGVTDVAVIGVEDEYFGEVVVAIVTGNVKKDELIKKANNKLATYQRPLFYDISKELPKNSLGKVQKFKLKEKYKNLQIGKRLKGLL
jgi:acyl-CoA synthetase (AMP-forming)/AMP-acid ligase II